MKVKITRMSDELLREFVLGLCDGRLFTSAQIDKEDVGTTFIVLALASDLEPKDFEDVGIVWEWMDKALPRTVNGRPMFTSCQLMHKDDWKRAHEAYEREMQRRKELQV